MNDVTLSLHSIIRLEERFDVKRIASCERIAERAWRNGKTPSCFSGRMRKFLESIQSRNDNTVVKIHAKNCYIFSADGVLLTAYSLESRYESYMNTLKPYESENYFEFIA